MIIDIRFKNKNKGFTLVEVMLAVALTGVVMVGVFGFWRFFTQNLNYSFAQSNAVDDAEYISSLIIRGIREMKESETGSYPLVKVEDQELSFYEDYDNDGRIELMRYVLQGSQLKRGIIEPTGTPVSYPAGSEVVKTVTDKVANGSQPVFYYYNANYPTDTVNNPLPLASRLLGTRMIGVDLIIATPSQAGTSSAEVIKATALRSLKNN